MWKHSLCSTCVHLRTIQNKRGSVFYLCEKSQADERFLKYPPQPVLRCPGHQPQAPKPK